MLPCCRLSLIVMLLSCPAFTRAADVVVLKNGDRIEGDVVSESKDTLSLRRSLSNGKIKYVQTIRQAEIARVQRGGGVASQPEVAASEPAEEEPRLPTPPITDPKVLLKSAVGKWNKKEYAAAGLEFSYMISKSSPGELRELSDRAKKETSLTLAELAAQAHFKGATERNRGRAAVRFSHVTDYEKPVLIPLIAEAYESALTEEVKPKPAPPARATRGTLRHQGRVDVEDDDKKGEDDDKHGDDDARHGRREKEGGEERGEKATTEAAEDGQSQHANSIAAWVERPAEYAGEKPEALALVGQIQFASSLISERIRLDPEVRKDKALRDKLTTDKARLGALLRAAAGRGTPRTADRTPGPVERSQRIEAFQRRGGRGRPPAQEQGEKKPLYGR